jgi:type II secretory pathway component PulM
VIGASAPDREREAKMKTRLSLLAAGLFVALSAPALAFQCPSEMAKIDTALATASLNEEQLNQVKQLRAEGERLHTEGQHQESIDTLAQAKTILGIE